MDLIAQKQAMDKALYYLGFRARTQAEMEKYLQKKEYPQDVIEAVMERLKEYGYIDDEKFASGMVENGSANKNLGARRIKERLYQTGIDKETAEKALAEIDEETELANARKWAQTILPRLNGEKRKEKLFRRLVSKGFGFDTTHTVIRELEYAFEANMEKNEDSVFWDED